MTLLLWFVWGLSVLLAGLCPLDEAGNRMYLVFMAVHLLTATALWSIY